jgi:hypothetical protein
MENNETGRWNRFRLPVFLLFGDLPLLLDRLVLFGTLAMLGHALAQDEPYPVESKVGETFDFCASALVDCPATYPMCDNLAVAILVDVPGMGIIAPGRY